VDGNGLTERLLRHDRAIVLLAIAGVVAAAAAYTVLGIGMPMSAIQMTTKADMGTAGIGMPSVLMPAAWSADYALLVFLMWWVMMVAMMLPSAAPTVLLYTALTRRTTAPHAPASLAATFMVGYLAVWAGFSLAATGLQWLLELRGLVSPATMTVTSSLLGGSVLLAAAAYQLSPLKRVCLEHCRSPMRFLVERRRSGQAGAFMMGIEHGAFCLGCCWALMALLFVGGIMNLYWIAGLALFVAAEKLLPRGERLAQALAAILALAGLWMLARGMW
jgi:predicted metal-binding membrane protein